MEYRLVLNNRSEYDIPNSVLSGQLHQDLKEEDTYHALRAAKSMKDISLVRYRHREGTAPPLERSDDLTASEMQYRPVPPQDIVDLIRHNYTNYLDKFASKDLFKLFVRRTSEQIIIQRLKKQEVRDRICKSNHWWWLNKKRTITSAWDVQKLLDIFFT